MLMDVLLSVRPVLILLVIAGAYIGIYRLIKKSGESKNAPLGRGAYSLKSLIRVVPWFEDLSYVIPCRAHSAAEYFKALPAVESRDKLWHKCCPNSFVGQS